MGMFDGLARWRPGSMLFGFLRGPKGIVDSKYLELTQEIVVGALPQFSDSILRLIPKFFSGWLTKVQVSVNWCTAACRRRSQPACWGAQDLGRDVHFLALWRASA